MPTKIPNLDWVKSWNPLLGEAIDALALHIDNIAQKAGVNPQGSVVAPTPPSSINVTANASGIHRVSWTDNSPRTRNLQYVHEWDTSSTFANGQPTVTSGHRQLSIAISGGTQPVYHRVCSQYPDGSRSPWVYFGSPTNPTGVVDSATVAGPPAHPTTGCGTSSTAGHGLGQEKFVSSPAAPGIPPKTFQAQ
jgi:hypothetical protein